MRYRTEQRIFTFQTRLPLNEAQDETLTAYARLYGKAERSLFAAISAGAIPAKLKPEYQRRFGITARQFNAVLIMLQGKIASVKERRPGLILEAETRIAKAEKVVAKLDKAFTGTNKLHQKMRRLHILKSKYSAMKSDHEAKTVRLCFGSRRLFRAQFSLEANGYDSLDAWRKDWADSRESEFFVVGSKDETAGCQGCVARVQPAGSISIRLRLPNALGSKHLLIKDVSFVYGYEAILASLKSGVAISYRFKRDEKGWRVFVSTSATAVKPISDWRLGAIGVDINADHLAVSELDRFGNLVASRRIPCRTFGRTQVQSNAAIGDAVKIIAKYAAQLQKPVVIEKLEFRKKKSELESVLPTKARLLSAFVFRKTISMLSSACYRSGVEVIEVNPAYTSVIGAVNHAQRQGISVHQGAAIAIARRGLRFSERPTVRTAVVPVRNGGHVTFDLPVRNRSKHVWSFWSSARTKLKAAHAAHYRSGRSKEPPSPLISEQRSVCSHRSLPAKPRHANRQQHCSAGVVDDVPW